MPPDFAGTSRLSGCSMMREAGGTARADRHDRSAFLARFMTPAIVMAGCLVLWTAAIRLLEVPVYIMPRPEQVAADIVAQRALYLQHSASTLTAILAGFFLAIAIGVPAAAAMVYFPAINRAIYPVLLTAQILPKVAIAPLFIIWFGFGLLPKVVMTCLICFFPIVIDTIIGLESVRPESLLLVRSMGGSRWQSFWKVRLPSALPSIFGGLKVAMTFAVVGTLVAEFVGSDNGLGYLLVVARGDLNTVSVFSCIVVLIILGFFLYYAVGLAERLVVKGRSRHRIQELGGGL
jgi:NitT/TauT family transport system permease protein